MNETLKKLVEESTDLVCTMDARGKILWINKASNKYLGVNPLKINGRLFSEFIHKKDQWKWENALKKAASGENLNTCEISLIHSNGDNILLNCSLVWDTTDKEYLCIGKSDSGIRAETNELIRSEEMYQILFDLSPIPKYVYDLETLRILDVNQAAIDHYGYSKEEFLNMKIQDLRIESDIPELMRAIERYKPSTGILRFGTYSHRKKDGSIVKMDISGQKFSFGDQTRVMIVSNDVTLQQNELRQKKLLADIRQIFGQEKKLNKILENLLAYLVDVGEFQLGEIWLISRDHKLLSLTTTYPKSDFTSIFYEQSSEIKIFKKGIGLPGSVWNGMKTEIWDGLGKLNKFIRKKAAKEVGLHSAMGIPIIYNEEL